MNWQFDRDVPPEIPEGFDATITQPSPLTFIRIQCRWCLSRAVRDAGCKVCNGKPIKTIPLEGEK